MIKGVIFDLDGVLTSTDKYHYEAWLELANKYGIYFDKEINNRLRGVSRMESLDIILEKSDKEYSLEQKQAMATEKNDKYVELLDNLSSDDTLPNAKEVLEKLKELGIKLAVGSSSKNTIKILEKTNLMSYFDFIADGTMIARTKPDPEVFLLAAKGLELDVSECVVVEDAVPGIEAGFNGGFTTVAIGDAKNNPHANYLIDDLIDILDLFKEQPKIKLAHLKKIYDNGVEAVKDFTLDINDGEFVVFVGPSGCGKSTVLRMIAGLESITDGTFLLDGKEMNNLEPGARDIAMVFQNYALYPHLSVRKNIGFPLINEKIPFNKWFNFKWRKERDAKINERVEEVAKKIGLYEYLDRKPKNLSGGQRQRVALGRAIIRNPKAFLLDEPLSNLDAKMRTEMRTEISKLHNDLHTIFIYVTHDQVEAMTMGTKIVVMKDGFIQQIGTPDDVFMNPTNTFVAGFIGTPQINFFDGQINGDKLFINDSFSLDIPASLKEKIPTNYNGKKVIVGIRPKKISVDDASSIKAVVSISEQLGDEALVYFKLDNDDVEHVLSSVTFKKYAMGQAINISIDLNNACIFDADTKENILQ